MQITAAQSITFFPSREDAQSLATRGEMTEAEGFYVAPARGRMGARGFWVIEVRDQEDGLLLGFV